MAGSTPTVLSIFTGAGGLDLGLEAAGFRVIGCIEVDKNARGTIRGNRSKSWPLIGEDAIDVDPHCIAKKIGIRRRSLAILTGGPPCQPFSTAAQWSRITRGMRDRRSRCIASFFKIAEHFLPRLILLENVPGFIRGSKTAQRVVKDALRGINRRNGTNYRLQWKILNAADYGVPQRRRRAIMVARRDGKKFEWPQSTHSDRPITAWDAIGALSGENFPRSVGKWARLLPSIPEGKNYQWHTDRGKGRKLFGYRTRYWSFLLKLAKNKPAWTIPAQPGPGTGPFHWDNRRLTVKELLKLQTFPLSWRVRGTYRVQVRQIGNATPPLLAEIIGRAIGRQIFRRRYPSKIKFRVSRKRKVPSQSIPTRVPLMYLTHEGTYPQHPGVGLGPKPVLGEQSHGKGKAA
jgi:DNA (cytosine-5)-methyltransferase 1